MAKIEFPDLGKRRIEKGNQLMIIYQGSNMAPTIKDGALVIVEKTKDLHSGLFAFQVGGDIIIRRLFKGMDGSVNEMNDNPDFKDFTESFMVGSVRAQKVIGRVIWRGQAV